MKIYLSYSISFDCNIDSIKNVIRNSGHEAIDPTNDLSKSYQGQLQECDVVFFFPNFRTTLQGKVEETTAVIQSKLMINNTKSLIDLLNDFASGNKVLTQKEDLPW